MHEEHAPDEIWANQLMEPLQERFYLAFDARGHAVAGDESDVLRFVVVRHDNISAFVDEIVHLGV